MNDWPARLHRDGQRILCGWRQPDGRYCLGAIAFRLQCSGVEDWGIFLEAGVIETEPGRFGYSAHALQKVRDQRRSPALQRALVEVRRAARRTAEGALEIQEVSTGQRSFPSLRPSLPFRRPCPVCGRTAFVTSDVLA